MHIKKDLGVIALLIMLCCAFFYRLFFPQPSLFFTPEIAGSDIWHYHYPIKWFIAQSLQHHTFPLWNSAIGGGFPLFAEGQMGVFNIYNFVSLFFLNTITAFNIGYIVIFAWTATGMYILCNTYKLSRLASVYAAFTFTFSGFFIALISHYNVIQAASFLPWLFWAFEKIRYKPRIYTIGIFSLLLSQQILSGFIQVTFITLLGLLLYLLFIFIQKKIRWPIIIMILISIGIGIMLSAIQLIPTIELTRISNRWAGVAIDEILRYAYPPVHLLSFLNPFYFGNPMKGMYPHFNKFSGSLFWENTGYIGLLPLLLLPCGLFVIRKNKLVQFFTLLSIIAFLLMIGRFGPFSFILTFMPFSFFRFSSRYLLLFVFSLTIVSGIGLHTILQKITQPFIRKGIGLLSILIQIITIFLVWWNYHPTVTYDEFNKPPPILNYTNAGDRIYTYKNNALWFRDFFIPNAYTTEKYLHFRNELTPNSNMLFNRATVKAYSGLSPMRLFLYSNLISDTPLINVPIDLTDQEIKILGLRSTKTIISPQPLASTLITLVDTIASDSANPGYWIYQNQTAVPHAYVVADAIAKKTVNDVISYLYDPSFNPRTEIIVEKENQEKKSDAVLSSEVKFIEETDRQVSLHVSTNTDGYLVLTDTYYPGWNVTIDGTLGQIIPANFVNRAVAITKGAHTVEFSYTPNSFYQGLRITIVSYLVIFCLMLLDLFEVFPYIGLHTKELFARHASIDHKE